MSLKDAERNLKGVGKTIARNTPGPKDLAYGFRESAKGIWIVWVFIAFLLLFGEPIAQWLTQPPAQQSEWECRSYPGYCDIDRDWRPKSEHKM